MSLVDLGKRLLESAKEGETEEVRQLMTNGAPFTTDWLGTSPLHMAAQYGHLATAEVLLRAGMSRDARTKVDRTPLHVAAQEGHIEIVELLLRHGADIEAKDMLKMTPLHWAVEKGNTEVVQCLLNHNADVNALSKFEKSPLDIAIDSQRTDLVQLIQEYAENVQIKPEVATIKSDPNPQVTVSPVIVKTVEAAAPKVIATPVSNASATPKKIVLPTMTTPTSNVAKTTVTPIRAVASKVQNARPILLHANLANLQRAAAATAAAAAAVGAHNKAASISEDSGDSADQSNTSVLATLAALAEATAPNTAASTTDAMQWLETHGISMLPADNSTIVASALEGGQTISLTEAGKLALEWVKDNNSTRVQDNSIASTIQNVAANTANQKVITIVADQSQLPSIISSAQNTPIVVVSGSTVKANTADGSPKNAFASSSSEPPSANGKPPGSKSSGENCEQLQKELEEVRRKAEEYRKLLEQKEQEAEVYRKQLEQIKTSQK